MGHVDTVVAGLKLNRTVVFSILDSSSLPSAGRGLVVVVVADAARIVSSSMTLAIGGVAIRSPYRPWRRVADSGSGGPGGPRVGLPTGPRRA